MGRADRREREVKLELGGAADRERLLARLPAPSAVLRQENHYYELPGGALRRAGVMLRLRTEGGAAALTVKEGARRDGAGIFDAAEREESVDPRAAARVIAEEATLEALDGPLLAALAARFGPLGALHRWGSLETHRSVHRLGGLVVEVDRVVYPDGSVLHEVEVESDEPEAARERLVAILEGAGVSWRPSSATKAERLARALEKEG